MQRLRLAFRRGIPRRSLLVALVVGPLLTLINQAEAIADPGEFSFLKFALTLLVPYVVATVGALGTVDAGDGNDR